MTNEDVIKELESLGFTPPQLLPTQENAFEYLYDSGSNSAIWFLRSSSTNSIIYNFKFYDGIFYRFARPSNIWIQIETMDIPSMIALYK